MSGLATILLSRGIEVSGSDLSLNERTRYLKEQGATIFEGHEKNPIPLDAVRVYHARIAPDHPELRGAMQKVHRLDLCVQTMGATPIYTVVGAHGKTSTSALLAHVLSTYDPEFGFSVGGVLLSDSLNGKDGSKGFVLEGDESDGSFLRISPKGAILTNVDADHLDYWKDYQSLLEGYKDFIKTVKDPTLFFYSFGEDLGLASCGVSYGIGEGQIQASNLRVFKEGSLFDLFDKRDNTLLKNIYIPLMGEHQVKNALGVYGLAKGLQVPAEQIVEAFQTFKGVMRRCERVKKIGRLEVFLDYGHHPRELEVTFEAIRKQYKTPLIVVFEPHKYSRTRNFFEDFVRVLKKPDKVILLDTYPAMEEYDPLGGSRRLAETLGIGVTTPSKLKLEMADLLGQEGCLLFIGAGNIDRICRDCLE
jgi:UDP-N-acetylmuramate--alanine ligase